MLRQIPLTEARDHFQRLVRDAESGETIQLTRRGQPVAVLLSTDEYARLRQTDQGVGFFEALMDFRQRYQLDQQDPQSGEFDDLRDATTGRSVEP